MATLVFHQRVYPEENEPSNGHRWESNCDCESAYLPHSRHAAENKFQWLPNQLQAVLDFMKEIHERNNGLSSCRELMDTALLQREKLRKEVDKYCRERNVSAH